MLALSCGFYETQIKWKEIQKIHVFVTKKKVPLTSYNTFYFLIDISWCIFTCAILKHVALNIISKNYHFPIPIALKKNQKKLTALPKFGLHDFVEVTFIVIVTNHCRQRHYIHLKFFWHCLYFGNHLVISSPR